jgi:hypothetical protein
MTSYYIEVLAGLRTDHSMCSPWGDTAVQLDLLVAYLLKNDVNLAKLHALGHDHLKISTDVDLDNAAVLQLSSLGNDRDLAETATSARPVQDKLVRAAVDS